MEKNTDRNVNVYQMLEARDKRVARQKNMLSAYACPVVSFTLNIPGPVKTSEHYLWAFEKGKKDILRKIECEGWDIRTQQTEYEVTGYEFMACVDCNPITLKKTLAELEEEISLGRLYDIDVIRLDGSKVGREEIGKHVRSCIICKKAAHVCGRNRSHTISELVNRIDQIILEAKSAGE